MIKNTLMVILILLLALVVSVNVNSAENSETSIAEVKTFFKNLEDNKLDSSYVFIESEKFFKKYIFIKPEHKEIWNNYIYYKGKRFDSYLIYRYRGCVLMDVIVYVDTKTNKIHEVRYSRDDMPINKISSVVSVEEKIDPKPVYVSNEIIKSSPVKMAESSQSSSKVITCNSSHYDSAYKILSSLVGLKKPSSPGYHLSGYTLEDLDGVTSISSIYPIRCAEINIGNQKFDVARYIIKVEGGRHPDIPQEALIISMNGQPLYLNSSSCIQDVGDKVDSISDVDKDGIHEIIINSVREAGNLYKILHIDSSGKMDIEHVQGTSWD
jgi:hypothetical protein